MIPLSKRVIGSILFFAMLLIFTLFFLLYVDAAPRNSNSPVKCTRFDPDKELMLVHVVLRHGNRTPADTYLTDPYVNETFFPYGWGQLTNEGKQLVYETGAWLRKKYDKFLGPIYSPDIIYAQSTGVARTQESMQLLLAGIFPPSKTPLEWNKNINWQPIAFQTEPLAQDSLLLVRIPCPRYHEELDRVFKETEIKDVVFENKLLFEKLTNITGLQISSPDDVQSLYSTLKAEKEYGLKLPQWTEEYYPKLLQNLTDLSYIYNVYNDELKKLKGGPFLKKMLTEWTDFTKGHLKPANRKIFAYTGHDSTVVNILAAAGIWEKQFPDYGTMAIFEFSKHLKTHQYGVEIYLKNSTTSNELQQLIIPGCDQFCSLENITELLQTVIPKDLKEECIPKSVGYTEPPPRGP